MATRCFCPSDSSLFARPSPKVRAGKKKRSCLSAAREPPVYQPNTIGHDVHPRVRTGAREKAPECRRPGSHRPMGWRAGSRELQKRHQRRKERRLGHPQRPKPPVSPSLPSSLVQSLVISPLTPPSWVILKPSNRSFARSSPQATRKLWSSGSRSASFESYRNGQALRRGLGQSPAPVSSAAVKHPARSSAPSNLPV
jgi:hypothetical protein